MLRPIILFFRIHCFVLIWLNSCNSWASKATPRNVLLLISDDMRPEINAYSVPTMHTPNIDRLAFRSMLFQHAYVQQAVCSPSRTSFLTGRRPDTTRVHDLIHYWRKVAGNFTTLPQYFKEHGYLTAGFGKVFHPGGASGHDDPISWTEDYFHPDEKYWNKRLNNSWYAATQRELEEHPLPDTQTTTAVLKMLQNLKRSGFDKSFFLAVGFHKPHLPFLFPSSFLDLYPREKVQLPNNSFTPRNIPAVAWSDFDELRKYDDILEKYGYGSINTTLPDDIVINLRRAYYASVSYVDSLIGMIMEKLTSVGLLNETIVVFIGDHGWQLGEHGEWCKHTNFELATRAPVLFSVPGVTDHGSETNQLVEFVDLFPTIVDAVGLPVPKLCPENSSLIQLCTEGTSFYQLLKYPNYEWKTASFSQYPRMLVSGDNIMGYSLRTQTYRYTEWVYYDTFNFTPLWKHGSKDYVELYDHENDPEENLNVAYSTEYSKVRKHLSKMLHDGWRSALPRHLYSA